MKPDEYLLWNQKKLQLLVALSVDDLTYMEIMKIMQFSRTEVQYYLDNLSKAGYIESYKMELKTQKRAKNRIKENTVFKITDVGKDMLTQCIEHINNMIPNTKKSVLKLREENNR
ncbi:hypothetical protein B5E87_04815 [Massilimicrobiota sp. An142]|uniref:winged helix-turn-helix domain-containing protein n=1 Tax=Massilimicrobiota TaxID=1924110 RepID=UPI000B3651AF|nr:MULTISPECIES: winged helix-turn-helix domain-containing protein [Massilimicrobiota]OUQ13903.1 hypothetical protein B5E87_04815 [Massilimicrobiota sp. An142]